MIETSDYKDRFVWAMVEAGKDAHAVADHLRISYQAVMKVLSGGSRRMAADNNARAAKFLGVSADWLATGAGTPARTDKPTESTADRYTADIIEILPKLTAEDRRRLAALLANIVGSGLSLSAFADMLSEPAVEPNARLLPGMLSPGAADQTAARPTSPIERKPNGLPHL